MAKNNTNQKTNQKKKDWTEEVIVIIYERNTIAILVTLTILLHKVILCFMGLDILHVDKLINFILIQDSVI